MWITREVEVRNFLGKLSLKLPLYLKKQLSAGLYFACEGRGVASVDIMGYGIVLFLLVRQDFSLCL